MKLPCYIFDLDGTLCDDSHRKHYLKNKPRDWDSYGENLVHDVPIEPVYNVLQSLSEKFKIVLLTGRSDDYRQKTIDWLDRHKIQYDGLYMRQYQDYRDDTIVKEELLEQIEDIYEVIGVFDDRKRVVDFWIMRGIFVFDVAQGRGNF
jgi:phosphoglycolate phosphatase-like HAD superfamily hydrolase